MHRKPQRTNGQQDGEAGTPRTAGTKGKTGPAKRNVVSSKNLRTCPPSTRQSSRPRFVPFERRKPPRTNHKTARRLMTPKRNGKTINSVPSTDGGRTRQKKARKKATSASNQNHELTRMANNQTDKHPPTHKKDTFLNKGARGGSGGTQPTPPKRPAP